MIFQQSPVGEVLNMLKNYKNICLLIYAVVLQQRSYLRYFLIKWRSKVPLNLKTLTSENKALSYSVFSLMYYNKIFESKITSFLQFNSVSLFSSNLMLQLLQTASLSYLIILSAREENPLSQRLFFLPSTRIIQRKMMYQFLDLFLASSVNVFSIQVVYLVSFSLRGKESSSEMISKKLLRSSSLSCPSTKMLSPDSFQHIVLSTLAKVVFICVLIECFPSLGVKYLQMFPTYLKMRMILLTV